MADDENVLSPLDFDEPVFGEPFEHGMVILTPDDEVLVKVDTTTGSVEICKTPEDETCKQAAELFWQWVDQTGNALHQRVKVLSRLLKEVRARIPGDDVVSALTAMQKRPGDRDLGAWIDEVLDQNKTFIEEEDDASP